MAPVVMMDDEEGVERGSLSGEERGPGFIYLHASSWHDADTAVAGQVRGSMIPY